MILRIESTSRTVEVNGVPARVWEGHTDSGIPVIALITRVAVKSDADTAQFERELQSCRPPSADALEVWPLRMVL